MQTWCSMGYRRIDWSWYKIRLKQEIKRILGWIVALLLVFLMITIYLFWRYGSDEKPEGPNSKLEMQPKSTQLVLHDIDPQRFSDVL